MREKPLKQHHMQFIDVHHHCVLPAYEQALVRAGAADPSRPLRKNSQALEAVETMASFGIRGAVVNPLSVAGVHHGDDEHARYLCASTGEALAQFVAAAPQQLGFFAPLPYPDIAGALKQMEYALDDLGADGLILLSNQNNVYVGDPLGEELWQEMNRRRAKVFIHPARPAYVDDLKLSLWASIIEYPFETTRVAANLIYHEYMKKYPDIIWILAHAGGTLPYLSMRMHLMEEGDTKKPSFAERVPEGVAPYIGKFYFDLAISGSHAALGALTAVTPPSHIMYGSDWPYIDRHYVTLQLDELHATPLLSGEASRAMQYGNAQALFPRFATLL
jgi:predicted TIM-barrel fold metal-dependent hydrolase